MIELTPLTEMHAAQVQTLCTAGVDYYEQVTGLPPGPAEAQSLFLAIPPRGDYAQRWPWGLFESDRLYGLVDGAFGHPREGHFWIGLLMLAPWARGQSRGSRALEAINDQARTWGAHDVISRKFHPAFGASVVSRHRFF